MTDEQRCGWCHLWDRAVGLCKVGASWSVADGGRQSSESSPWWHGLVFATTSGNYGLSGGSVWPVSWDWTGYRDYAFGCGRRYGAVSHLTESHPRIHAYKNRTTAYSIEGI